MFITKETLLDIDALRDYLKYRIGNWYKVVKEDYNISGEFINIATSNGHLIIKWIEEGKECIQEIHYYNDYTMEQIYDIWVEYDAEKDSINS
jgi:hypothetical protein